MAIDALPIARKPRLQASTRRPSHRTPTSTSASSTPLPPSRWLSFWRQLPPEARETIFRHLHPRDLWSLTLVSDLLVQLIDPRRVPREDKKAAVMEALNTMSLHWPRTEHKQEHQGNFGCLLSCFRIRGPENFEAEQAQTALMYPDGLLARDVHPDTRPPWPAQRLSLPMFCIECGVRSGFYAAGDQIRTRTGQELWICSCRWVWRKANDLESRVCPRCCDRCLSSAKSSRMGQGCTNTGLAQRRGKQLTWCQS